MRRLDIFKAELELVETELLGLASEAVALDGINDWLNPLDRRVGLPARVARARARPLPLSWSRYQ